MGAILQKELKEQLHFITSVWFLDGYIYVKFQNEKIIGTPISWYKNLSKGTPEQILKYELWNDGRWIHLEELDEDLSAEGFLLIEQKQ